jgi:maltooligosyltrehalose trehalohydrolase
VTGRVSVWAPNADRVELVIGDGTDTVVMGSGAGGWWYAQDQRLTDGARYGFRLDDDKTVLPDPRSRRQPDGVHGMSAIYHHRYAWHDGGWRGRPLRGAIIYELHVGTFSTDGTFAGVISHLDHLVELGVTHLELLPVNDFNGAWNWGYDGVHWFAVHEAYGGPDGLKHLVDECHRRGLAVLLDVVYNHLGPSGNYLPRFGPYLTSGRNTWGEQVNLDGAGSSEVRRHILDNALMWLAEFHLDGLRLDAIHALRDTGPVHLLAEMSEQVADLSRELGRELILVAESDLNDPVVITPVHEGGWGMDAQWDDDVHHALHALLTGERQGYYVDFGSLDVVRTVFTGAYLHAGTYSTFRRAVHGRPIDRSRTPGYRFVVSLQNHDQVGNRAAGERLSELTSPGRLRVAAVLLFTSPYTPMLWMGEEWAASTRWPFFTSHPEPELARAVAAGRIEEFSRHGWDASPVPDPQDPGTFRSARLDWGEVERAPHARMLSLYRTLIRLRTDHPDLADPDLSAVDVRFDAEAGWLVVVRGSLRVVASLASEPVTVPESARSVILRTDDGVAITPGGVLLPPETAVIVDSG